MQAFVADLAAVFQVPAKIGQPEMDRLIAKQRGAIVRDELDRERQLVQPCGRFLGTVEVDLFLFPSKIMGEAVKRERRATADQEGLHEQGLQRYDDVLP